MTETPNEAAATSCHYASKRDLKTQLGLGAVCLLWAICFLVATHLVKLELPGPLPWLVAAAPSLAAIGVLYAYYRFLRDTDELQRLIQLQALAWGFGGGFFVLVGYSLFEKVGAPPADDGDLLAVLPILYAIGTLIGTWRYR